MKSNYKSKKKTLAITTVIMVAMLIVALSTATFAWYSTNNSVKANDLMITSASSNSAALAIDTYKNLASTKNSIDLELTGDNNNNLPMIPMLQPIRIGQAGEVTSYDDFVSDNATKGFNSCEVDGDSKFITDKLNPRIMPNRITGVKAAGSNKTETQDYFYVINTNSKDVGVNVKVTIYGEGSSPVKYTSNSAPEQWTTVTHYSTQEKAREGGESDVTTYTKDTTYYVRNSEIAKHLRVAVFINEQLLDIWANWYRGPSTPAAVVYAQWGSIGSVADKESAYGAFADQTYATLNAASNSTGGTMAIQIPAKDGVKVQLAAWFDGNVLTNVDMSSSTWFKVSFEVNG